MFSVHFKSQVAYGTTGEAYGYGRVWVELCDELSKRDDVKLVDDWMKADLQVCWMQPFWHWEYYPWYKREHPVQVLYTTWECTRIPQHWRRIINEREALFTTSRFCVEVFKDCGVEVPVHLVGHGVNAEKFPYMERDWNNGNFVFFWQGVHPADRKGMKLVHRAFKELNLKDAILIEKWHPIFSRNWIDGRPSNPIKQFGCIFEKSEYMKLLARCHASINPTRGEGFGFLPLEAAATGMFTAVTPWSGVTDYLDGMNYWPINYELSKHGEAFFVTSTSIELENKKQAYDAVPQFDDVKAAMLWAYENRKEAEEMGRQASSHVLANNGWNKSADEFVAACRKVLNDC